SPLTFKRNWVENFFTEADDFMKNWNWDMSLDVPMVNVREEKEFFLIDVAAPGMKKEDFKLEIDNGILMISAHMEDKTIEKTEEFQRKEFNFRNFKRSFWLPDNVNSEKIMAKYENGLLTLTLPKMKTTPAVKSKMIQVV
ncbi:MAG TPA: Hsp20/alpha crystallin family protein, partial [Saprospiraceae bacterium]|nr:Hsp20/alpha crystallin family protein [Saprospiraceae bacterium]